MSRFTVSAKNGGNVSYGLDHALGWWADLEDSEGEEVAEAHTHGGFAKPGGRAMIIDFIRAHADPEELVRHEKFLGAILMDIDPGEVREATGGKG